MKWKITTLAGIGVYIHWSFWLLPLWLGSSVLGAGSGLPAAVSMLILLAAVFGCVVLHELGHALAARHYGIGTHDITLYPIGGVASLERIPSRPFQELVIAVAGPLVNVGIAAALMLAIGLGPGFAATLAHPTQSFMFQMLAINVGLVLFNMLPAFPMDGGRVLRALLATLLPYPTATVIAGRIGQGLAVIFGLIGLFLPSWNLLLVATFVFLAATGEIGRVSGMFSQYGGISVEPPLSSRTGEDSITWLGDVQPYVDRDSGRIYVVRRGWSHGD